MSSPPRHLVGQTVDERLNAAGRGQLGENHHGRREPLRFLVLLAFAVAGLLIALPLAPDPEEWTGRLPPEAVAAVVGAVSGLLLGAAYLFGTTWLTQRSRKLSLPALVGLVVGLLSGLLAGALLSLALMDLGGWLGLVVPAALTLGLGVLGLTIGMQRGADYAHGAAQTPAVDGALHLGQILVDTSVIIDGRVADLAGTGFLRGRLLVPRFVLDELRHVADSSDALRRNRGRRGLEVLARLRADPRVTLEIEDIDLAPGTEVDAVLVSLARERGVPILTTDFNLNRVAEVQGVTVLNLNGLASALKPVVLPGEDLGVNIVQEGKEPGQGIAFLDDGTMVVVEGGRRFIGSSIDVSVTRVLQTAVGRIIFAQPKVGG